MNHTMKKAPDNAPGLSRFERSVFIGRCLLLLLFLSTWPAVAGTTYSQSVRLSLDMKNATVRDVLFHIEKKSEFYFTYNVGQVNTTRKVSVTVHDKTVMEILDQLFAGENVRYVINDKHIVLFKGDANAGQTQAAAQQPVKRMRVSGTVNDASGLPVIGANVVEKGVSSNGTITDVDGKFTLTVPAEGKLVVSYIGYNTKEIAVKGQPVVNVTLDENTRALDEVVVVGYGTQKKVNLTGSVASISAETLTDRAQTNILSSMQGSVPGVTIISQPGKDPSINFRGRGNLGKSEPLYVIDGAISDATFFANLDPNSIENISFLKDAASSAIYGARAAYGVVLVTTKQGKEGRIQVTYNGMVGTKMPTYKPDLVNSWEYAELYNESLYNSNPALGKNQRFSAEEIGWFKDGSKPDLYPNTNWFDLVYDDHAITTQHSLNFTGGSQKIRYFAGLGYIYDEENLRQRNNQRYNLNLNITSDLTDWLTFRGSVKYIQRTRAIDGGTPDANNMFIVPSTFVARQTDGEWGSVVGGQEADGTFAGGNPLRSYGNADWTRGKIEHSMYELGFDLKPVKGLVVTGQGVYKSFEDKNKVYVGLKDAVPSFLKPGATINGTSNTVNQMTMTWKSDSWLNYTATANYNWSNQVHAFGLLAGISYEHYKYEKLEASRQDFPNDLFTDMSAGATSGANYKNDSESYEYKMLSYFARFNYTLLDRYMFEANLRADGSSRFYEDNRWGYFPSFSAGWRISEEAFMSETKSWLDNLKLRVSYGTLGNINNVGNYDYFQTYAAKGNYTFDDSPVKGVYEVKPANPALSWEKVALTDAGVDFDLFNGKLSGTADFYVKNTDNILLEYNVPSEIGISKAPSQNLAKVRNTGFELSLTHRNTIGNVTYAIGGNLSTNRNRITDLASSNDIIKNIEEGHGVVKYILREDEAVSSFYGFKSDGLYTQEEIDAGHYYTYGGVTPNAGDIKFVPQRDLKWGEAITDDDRTIIGREMPAFTYGLNLNVQYKNFELGIFGQGVGGAQVGFEVYQVHPFFHGQDSPHRYHMSRWTEANPDPHAIYPRIYTAGDVHTTYNRAFSDYELFDADYFRFKNITLGYTVPKELLNRINLQSLKLYLTAENLFTIRADRKMKDFDPETYGSVVKTLGTKSVAFGINVSF